MFEKQNEGEFNVGGIDGGTSVRGAETPNVSICFKDELAAGELSKRPGRQTGPSCCSTSHHTQP